MNDGHLSQCLKNIIYSGCQDMILFATLLKLFIMHMADMPFKPVQKVTFRGKRSRDFRFELVMENVFHIALHSPLEQMRK